MTLEELVEGIVNARGWMSGAKGDGIVIGVPQGDGSRKQDVFLSTFESEEGPMVRLTSRIGSAKVLDARRLKSALELNFRIPTGSLAIDGEDLVMTDTRPLKTTTPETSGSAVAFLAELADRYEKQFFGTDVH